MYGIKFLTIFNLFSIFSEPSLANVHVVSSFSLCCLASYSVATVTPSDAISWASSAFRLPQSLFCSKASPLRMPRRSSLLFWA